MTNTKYANGWIEGFDDTEPHIQKAAETLYSENKAAIAHIGSKEVLVAYPPGSHPFSFLGDTPQPRGYLTLALRDTLGPVNRLLRISEQNSYYHSAEVNNTVKSGHRESTLMIASGPRKPPRDFDVAQQSTGPPSTASPSLNVPDTALSRGLDSAMAQTQTNTSPVQNSHAQSLSSSNQVSTDTSDVLECFTPADSMNLDPHPTEALTPGHSRTESAAARVDLNKLFLNRFGITFEKLAAIGGTDKKAQRAKVFYVWYPEDSQVVKDEKDLITRFLRVHTRLLFSNSVNVDWERFTTMVNENNMHGVVLVCPPCLTSYCPNTTAVS
jgi:chromo domain-containing protein 1